MEESNAAHLDPLLTLAVMRVESEFDDDATSLRGARGLMQIKPTTLRRPLPISRESGYPREEILRDPVLSTRLAVRYLGRLNQAARTRCDPTPRSWPTTPGPPPDLLGEGRARRRPLPDLPAMFPPGIGDRLRALPPSTTRPWPSGICPDVDWAGAKPTGRLGMPGNGNLSQPSREKGPARANRASSFAHRLRPPLWLLRLGCISMVGGSEPT